MNDDLDILRHNASAWDRFVELEDPLTKPVTPEEVARARVGDLRVTLTTTKSVPPEWIGDPTGRRILCLAGGGGQQAPLFAAAGARVTVLDISPKLIAQDRLVAEREGLDIAVEPGSMTDLSRFEPESFDLVFHPLSNFNVPDVRVVWREVGRVLRTGGRLLAGFMNPAFYLFDPRKDDGNTLVLRHALPYADADLPEDELRERIRERRTLEHSHSLEAQIAGQIEAGFVITGLYEDTLPGHPVSEFLPPCVATRAEKAGPL